MQSARNEYESLSRDYDAFLAHAHQFNHGSQQMLDALRKANELGPKVEAALREYYEAVKNLTLFYQKPDAGDELAH